jgi:hypothetical protein
MMDEEQPRDGLHIGRKGNRRTLKIPLGIDYRKKRGWPFPPPAPASLASPKRLREGAAGDSVQEQCSMFDVILT